MKCYTIELKVKGNHHSNTSHNMSVFWAFHHTISLKSHYCRPPCGQTQVGGSGCGGCCSEVSGAARSLSKKKNTRMNRKQLAGPLGLGGGKGTRKEGEEVVVRRKLKDQVTSSRF